MQFCRVQRLKAALIIYLKRLYHAVMYPLNKKFSEALNFPGLSNIYTSTSAHLVQPNMPTQTEARRHDKVLLAAFIASLIVSILVILLTLVIGEGDTNQSTTDTIHSNGTANTTPPTPMRNQSETQAVSRSESPNR